MASTKKTVTFMGNPLTLLGNNVEIGQKAPAFTVLNGDLEAKSLDSYKGKKLLISVVPSLDTEVCSLQTRRFNEEATKMADDVRVLTISCDLPFAQARWCGAAGIKHVETLSDHKDLSFGMAYGVVIQELRLLARAVFVVNKEGVVTYTNICPEVTHEPDYQAALKALASA